MFGFRNQVALVRVDDDAKRIARCLKIATLLRDRGASVLFLNKSSSSGFQSVLKHGFQIVEKLSCCRSQSELAGQQEIDYLIVDQCRQPSTQTKIGSRTTVIQFVSDETTMADVIISADPFEQHKGPNWDCDVLAGAEFDIGSENDVDRATQNNSQKNVDVDQAPFSQIVRAILASRFRFRPCRSDDSALLYTWRNDPELRVVCFQQGQLDFASHQAWLTERLNSQSTEIYMIEDGDKKSVGQTRLEFGGGHRTVRLHISLIPSLRGSGLGTALVERTCRMVSRRFGTVEACAFIKPNNHVSQAVFRKAGFDPDSMTTINGQIAMRFSKSLQPKIQTTRQSLPDAA